jgi:hypothetical protein
MAIRAMSGTASGAALPMKKRGPRFRWISLRAGELAAKFAVVLGFTPET